MELKQIEIFVSSPTVPKAKTLTKDDVWSGDMIIARSGQICPVWGDQLPYKSVTVTCKKDQVDEVKYWLEYVHGANSVSKMSGWKGKVAMRSDYQCW